MNILKEVFFLFILHLFEDSLFSLYVVAAFESDEGLVISYFPYFLEIIWSVLNDSQAEFGWEGGIFIYKGAYTSWDIEISLS